MGLTFVWNIFLWLWKGKDKGSWHDAFLWVGHIKSLSVTIWASADEVWWAQSCFNSSLQPRLWGLVTQQTGPFSKIMCHCLCCLYIAQHRGDVWCVMSSKFIGNVTIQKFQRGWDKILCKEREEIVANTPWEELDNKLKLLQLSPLVLYWTLSQFRMYYTALKEGIPPAAFHTRAHIYIR